MNNVFVIILESKNPKTEKCFFSYIKDELRLKHKSLKLNKFHHHMQFVGIQSFDYRNDHSHIKKIKKSLSAIAIDIDVLLFVIDDDDDGASKIDDKLKNEIKKNKFVDNECKIFTFSWKGHPFEKFLSVLTIHKNIQAFEKSYPKHKSDDKLPKKIFENININDSINNLFKFRTSSGHMEKVIDKIYEIHTK